MSIQLKTPAANLIFTFDWTADLQQSVNLQSVAYEIPANLQLVNQQMDATNGLSTIEIAGGTHGDLSVVRAEATLSSGETVPGEFTLRVMR